MHLSLESSNAINFALGDEYIINIYSQYDPSRKSRSLKDSTVYFTRSQSLGEDKLIEFHKPHMWAMLQTINSVMEKAYLSSPPMNHIPRLLLYKDTLSKIVVDDKKNAYSR